MRSLAFGAEMEFVRFGGLLPRVPRPADMGEARAKAQLTGSGSHRIGGSGRHGHGRGAREQPVRGQSP